MESNAKKRRPNLPVSTSVLNLAQLLEAPSVAFSDIDPSVYADWYLHSCYPKAPFDDEKIILEFLSRQAKNINGLSSLLDIGCGPVVSHVMPFAHIADSIVMSDLLDQNLELIGDWIEKKPSCHNWSLHTAHILRSEGESPSIDHIRKREELLRSKIKNLQVGDLRSPLPISSKEKFSAVMCIYATEQAARDQFEWFEIVQRLGSMVEEDGHLFIACVRNSSFYAIHDRNKVSLRIPIVQVTESMLINAAQAAGFNRKSIVVDSVDVKGLGEESLDGVLLLHAHKRKIR